MTNVKSVSGLMLLAVCSGLACGTETLHFPAGTGGTGGINSSNDCPLDSDWLSETSPTNLAQPLPHPNPECPFYQASVRYFLSATLAASGPEPALASYATIDDVFTRPAPLAPGALASPGAHRGTASRAWLGNVKQPGNPNAILIDQAGHAVYYGIHLDDGFVGFVDNQQLQTVAAIRNVDPNLEFTPGLASFRSAWMDIDPADGVTGDFSRFVTTNAWVSTLHADPATGTISEDKDHPRQIRVALLALEVGFSLPGHPEMIWATFQHVDASGLPDVAPGNLENPPNPGDPPAPIVVNATSTWLYHGGTPTDATNSPYYDAQLTLDEATQTFAQQTSVYRMFPASRSNTTLVNAEVGSLNAHLADEFARRASAGIDPRSGYRLMGAMWLDKPATFGVNQTLQNDAMSPFVTGNHIDQDGHPAPAVSLQQFTQSIILDGTDSPFSIVGGMDRLSNPAVESFTQAPGNFNNCLACHNTQATSAQGVPAGRILNPSTLLAPGLLNVSQVFSRSLLDACGPTGVCPAP